MKNELSSQMFGGWTVSAAPGVSLKPGIGGDLSVGIDIGLSGKNPVLGTLKLSGGVGIGIGSPINISVGGSYAQPQSSIMRFSKD